MIFHLVIRPYIVNKQLQINLQVSQISFSIKKDSVLKKSINGNK